MLNPIVGCNVVLFAFICILEILCFLRSPLLLDTVHYTLYHFIIVLRNRRAHVIFISHITSSYNLKETSLKPPFYSSVDCLKRSLFKKKTTHSQFPASYAGIFNRIKFLKIQAPLSKSTCFPNGMGLLLKWTLYLFYSVIQFSCIYIAPNHIRSDHRTLSSGEKLTRSTGTWMCTDKERVKKRGASSEVPQQSRCVLHSVFRQTAVLYAFLLFYLLGLPFALITWTEAAPVGTGVL